MNSDEIPLQRFGLILVAVIAVFCAGAILVYAKSVIQPLLVAFFASLLLNPLVSRLESWLEKTAMPHWMATVVAVPTAMLVAALVLLVVGMIFFANLAPIVDAWPRYIERGDEWIDKGIAFLRDLGVEKASREFFMSEIGKISSDPDMVKSIQKHVEPGPILSFLTGGVTSFIGFLGNLFLILIYMVFMLFEAADWRKKAEKQFGLDNPYVKLVNKISANVQVYLSVKTWMSLITGTLTVLVCWLFGVDFPLFWGVLAFGLNYIPYLGSAVASTFPALLALFQYDNPMIAIGVLLALMIVQNMVGSVVEPKVMGNKSNISPLVLLVSLVLWGWLWGVVGMVLSVVFAVAIQLVMREMPGLKSWSKMLDAKVTSPTMLRPVSEMTGPSLDGMAPAQTDPPAAPTRPSEDGPYDGPADGFHGPSS